MVINKRKLKKHIHLPFTKQDNNVIIRYIQLEEESSNMFNSRKEQQQAIKERVAQGVDINIAKLVSVKAAQLRKMSMQRVFILADDTSSKLTRMLRDDKELSTQLKKHRKQFKNLHTFYLAGGQLTDEQLSAIYSYVGLNLYQLEGTTPEEEESAKQIETPPEFVN